jgi:hypothetical protein
MTTASCVEAQTYRRRPGPVGLGAMLVKRQAASLLGLSRPSRQPEIPSILIYDRHGVCWVFPFPQATGAASAIPQAMAPLCSLTCRRGLPHQFSPAFLGQGHAYSAARDGMNRIVSRQWKMPQLRERLALAPCFRRAFEPLNPRELRPCLFLCTLAKSMLWQNRELSLCRGALVADLATP